MVKRVLIVAMLTCLLISVFVVPSQAFFNGYLAQGEGTAMLWIPVYDTYAIDVDYLPVDFNAYASVDKPLLLFNQFDNMFASADSQENIYISQDDSLSAREGFAYGLSIFDVSSDGYGDVSLAVINFSINLYEYKDGEWLFVDTIIEPDYLETPSANVYMYFYLTGIISPPDEVSAFFAYMYPMLPLTWTDYSKLVNGSYNSGLQDGIIRGRQQINQKLIEEAFTQGETKGFQVGYDKAIADDGNLFYNLVDAVIFAPVNGIVEMMNFDFFGVNVSYIFLALLTVLILAGILTFVARFFI